MRTHDYLRKRKKGENVTKQKKYPGTPTYHSTSARNGRQAANSVARQTRMPARVMRIPSEIQRENQMRSFRLGVLVGFAATALVLGAVLWLWVIPTMDAAVATAQGMVM